jgi:hypothetical protein
MIFLSYLVWIGLIGCCLYVTGFFTDLWFDILEDLKLPGILKIIAFLSLLVATFICLYYTLHSLILW